MEPTYILTLLLTVTAVALPAQATESKPLAPWHINHDGVGPIHKDLPLDNPKAMKRIFHRCRLATSTKMQDNKPHEKVVDVMCGGKTWYTLHSASNLKSLASADVVAPGAKSPQGIKVGQTLGDVYKLGQVDCDADVNPATVRCVFLGDTTIAYSAKDTTSKADGLLPPQEQIKKLKITGIIWRANML